MNQILEWLSGGNLRSDGMSNEVADFVLQHPEVCEELVSGLDETDEVVRARTVDALEKVSRSRPDLMIEHLPKLVAIATTDDVAMVKMHVAMILGHLAIYGEHIEQLTLTLLELLEDKHVFAVSWAITSLCIIGRKYPNETERIVNDIAKLQGASSAAIRSRVRKALALLTNEDAPFPKGWVKSEHLGLI